MTPEPEAPLSDADLADAIATERDDRTRVRLIEAFWWDPDRARRAPRALLYLHMAMLCGMVDRLLDEQATWGGPTGTPS